VYERPADLTDSDVADALRWHWSLDVADVRYAAVGYGGYHWTVADVTGLRWFVTASRLTATADLADLRATMGAARDLADAGQDFVVAPVRADTGEVVIRARPGYAISMFPFADGIPLRFDDALSAADRLTVTDMLASLHTARLPGGPVPIRDLNPRSRSQLEISIRERGRPWRGGPYAEAARALVSEHADGLLAALAAFDELTVEVAASSPLVLTHGEPHPGNLVRRGAGYLLIDWDTAGLAPPERDLWSILSDAGAEAARYAELTGHEVSPRAVSLYRLRWDLDDVGLFLADFTGPHERDKDTEVGWAGLADAVQRLVASARHQ
jgi:spectinomycin phosphotransferase